MVKDVISITAVHSLTMDARRERLVLSVDMLRARHIAATRHCADNRRRSAHSVLVRVREASRHVHEYDNQLEYVVPASGQLSYEGFWYDA